MTGFSKNPYKKGVAVPFRKNVLGFFRGGLIALCAGFVAGFLFLEVLVRVIALGPAASQWLGNMARRQAKTDWVILCFGESMTADAYPAYLQWALSCRYPGQRFSVVDKGLSSSDSGVICDILDEALDRYRPDMVVVMTGINDNFDPALYDRNPARTPDRPWYTRLGTYRLIRFLWQMHVKEIWTAWTRKHGRRGAPVSPDETLPPEDLKLSMDFLFSLHRFAAQQKGSFFTHPYSPIAPPSGHVLSDAQVAVRLDEAVKLIRQNQPGRAEAVYMPIIERATEQFNVQSGRETLVAAFREIRRAENREEMDGFVRRMFQRIVEANPRALPVYDAYFFWLQDNLRALEFVRPLVESFPGPFDYLLSLALQGLGRQGEAQDVLERAVDRNPIEYHSLNALINLYARLQLDDLAVSRIQKSLAAGPCARVRNTLYGNLANVYRRQGRTELARQYQSMSRFGYGAKTRDNYRRIIRTVTGRRIRMVCMQYPMLSVAPLKEIAEDFLAPVLVVDNEKSFLNAVSRDGTSRYFKDNFGGLFGHLTPDGCNLLASNIVQVIDPVIRQGSSRR